MLAVCWKMYTTAIRTSSDMHHADTTCTIRVVWHSGCTLVPAYYSAAGVMASTAGTMHSAMVYSSGTGAEQGGRTCCCHQGLAAGSPCRCSNEPQWTPSAPCSSPAVTVTWLCQAVNTNSSQRELWRITSILQLQHMAELALGAEPVQQDADSYMTAA